MQEEFTITGEIRLEHVRKSSEWREDSISGEIWSGCSWWLIWDDFGHEVQEHYEED